ncbi:MAG: DUF1287 domain-containing protein [Candidatus Caenarcaniphilales bacterium]|nr:DUF1287 domain-containing protein [Candidatus Caenarcaniphilales bacterium]
MASETQKDRLAQEAHLIAKRKIKYKASYQIIDYPGGDIPASQGVCTDLVIRAYRKIRIDLQKEIHEDMQKNFHKYLQTWGQKKADSNIDHRRVKNLSKFFQRKGKILPITDNPCDYKPGDIIVWDTSFGNKKLDHIGIVANSKALWCSGRYQTLHHGWGNPREDDSLFLWPITDHYRYP